MSPRLKKEIKMKKSPEEFVKDIFLRQNELREKAKQTLLPKYLGKWVIQELTATSSLDIAKLTEYIASANLDIDERSALENFLASLNDTANHVK